MGPVAEAWIECPDCSGRGTVWIQSEAQRKVEVRCETCKGRGEVYEDPGPKIDARKGDPQTSRLAAHSSYGRRVRRMATALRVFQEAGDRGLTDYELSIPLGIPEMRNVAAKVRGRLVRERWVEETGGRRPTDTGSLAKVWRVTEEAKAVPLSVLFPGYGGPE